MYIVALAILCMAMLMYLLFTHTWYIKIRTDRNINFRAYLDSFILNVPEKNNGGEYRLCSAFRHYSF